MNTYKVICEFVCIYLKNNTVESWIFCTVKKHFIMSNVFCMVEVALTEIAFTLFIAAQKIEFPFKQFCSKCERIQTTTKEFFK